MSAVSALLLAAAVLVAPGSAVPRSRLLHPGRRVGHRAAAVDWAGLLPGASSRRAADCGPLALAAAWELLAAGLRAGMPIPSAVRAVADRLEGAAGAALRQTADLLALGADVEQAWQPAWDCDSTARLAGFARRSGRSGTALAESVARLAVAQRASARDQSEADAQRAGVLIAGPLGLCFLPAFIALGVVPVVIGLAMGLMQQW